MVRRMGSKLRRSSGNVFRDVGFRRVEAENLRIRSELMLRLERLIDSEDLTQSAAARLLGVSQPRVSDLVRGRIELFSIDSLVNMLARAGVYVTVTTRRRRRAA
jgi:predicted XRE-type DNA-binding protein